MESTLSLKIAVVSLIASLLCLLIGGATIGELGPHGMSLVALAFYGSFIASGLFFAAGFWAMLR